MRYDEAWTFLHYASRPLFEGISNYSAPNNHIFHTALVHAVYMMFGNHPWLLRLPALMAGLAIIPTTYLLGTALHGRATGLLAAGFATLSAPLIDYSVNARGYTMMTFLSTTAFAIAVGVMEAPSRWTIGSAVIQHDNVRAGSNGLRLGPMRGGVFQPLTLKRSTKYQFIVSARLTAGQDVGWTGISLGHSAPAPQKHQCEIRTANWHECTLTFTTAADPHESMVWAWKNEGPARVEADHFRVEEKPE